MERVGSSTTKSLIVRSNIQYFQAKNSCVAAMTLLNRHDLINKDIEYEEL